MRVLSARANYAGGVEDCGEGERMIDIEKIDAEKIGAGTIGVEIENVSRRGFLQGMLSASAFLLCVRIPLLVKAASSGAPGLASVGSSAFHPSLFVGIH